MILYSGSDVNKRKNYLYVCRYILHFKYELPFQAELMHLLILFA